MISEQYYTCSENVSNMILVIFHYAVYNYPEISSHEQFVILRIAHSVHSVHNSQCQTLEVRDRLKMCNLTIVIGQHV